jgi:hypothetical protein
MLDYSYILCYDKNIIDNAKKHQKCLKSHFLLKGVWSKSLNRKIGKENEFNVSKLMPALAWHSISYLF